VLPSRDGRMLGGLLEGIGGKPLHGPLQVLKQNMNQHGVGVVNIPIDVTIRYSVAAAIFAMGLVGPLPRLVILHLHPAQQMLHETSCLSLLVWVMKEMGMTFLPSFSLPWERKADGKKT
jgi:hypothetical protein